MKKELNLFIVFEAIMRTGSVAKAAESLCLSSSAVSQSLTRLRDKHNEPLFVRESRGLTPTSYALKLYDSI